MRKGKLTLVIAASLALALAACNKEEEAVPEEAPAVEQPADNKAQAPEAEEEAVLVFAKGEFIGQADPHSVEVKVGDKLEVFQIDEEVQAILMNLEADTPILFTYNETAEGQKVMVTAEVQEGEVAEAPVGTQTGMWNFVGIMDNHSAEFEVGGESLVVQYDEQLASALNALNEGEPVMVEYHENEHSQLVLEKVEKH